MSAARPPVDDPVSSAKKTAGRMDDNEAAKILVGIERSSPRKLPDQLTMKRAGADWADGFIQAQQSGEKGTDRWLRTIKKRDAAWGAAADAAIKLARLTPADETDPDEDLGDIIDRWPVIDDAAFYGIMGEIVRAADPHTEADPVAVLVQLLVGYCNAVGRWAHFVAGADRHYLSLFTCLVGVTSNGRKGSSWSVTEFFLKMLDETWSNDRVADGLSTGEGLIYAVRDRVVKVNKDGEEVEEDPGVADKRLLLVETEMGRTIKNMNKEGNILSNVLRNAWDCRQTLSNMTKNSPNKATGAFISIIGHITQTELNRLLTQDDASNGAANRFLWVCSRKSKNLPEGGDLFSENWDEVAGRLKAAFERARGVGKMHFDRESREHWRAVHDDLAEGHPGILGHVLGRALPQVKRIACAYAITDGESTVRLPHLKAALALWRYSESSARFIFGDSLGDPKAEKLLGSLKSNPNGLTQSQISIDVFARNLSKSDLAKLLEKLLNLGLIHRLTREGGGPGRKATVWFAGSAHRAHTK